MLEVEQHIPQLFRRIEMKLHCLERLMVSYIGLSFVSISSS